MANSSSNGPWALTCKRTSKSKREVRNIAAAPCEGKSVKNGAKVDRNGNKERISESQKDVKHPRKVSLNPGEIESSSSSEKEYHDCEKERQDTCREKRWGEGIFFHDNSRCQGGKGYGVTCERINLGGGKLCENVKTERDATCNPCGPDTGISYCIRDCYSALSFRPTTANLGYRTRAAYVRGFGSDRLGQMFECTSCRQQTACDAVSDWPPLQTSTSTKMTMQERSSGNKRGQASQEIIRSGKSFASGSATAPTRAQLSAAAAAKAVVKAAACKDPSMNEDDKARLYASEFFSKNPCLAYLPWQQVKKKKKKKDEGERRVCGKCQPQLNCPCREIKEKKKPEKPSSSPEKCICATHVETMPMMSTKFTETDWLKHDQCTWMDNHTSDKCVGTELVTFDQFTNVRPEDIDGPHFSAALRASDESSFGEVFKNVSFIHSQPGTPNRFSSLPDRTPTRVASQRSLVNLSRPASQRSLVNLSRPTSRHSVVNLRQYADVQKSGESFSSVVNLRQYADVQKSGESFSYAAHTLVNHPVLDNEQPKNPHRMTVPASFCTIGQQQQGCADSTWDGLVLVGGGISCCPPCVGDPCSLSRFWRRTPKFSHVVRAAPLCDCCTTKGGRVGGKTVL